jgi:phage tail sheath gpL-like
VDGNHALQVGVAVGDTAGEIATELRRVYRAHVASKPLPFVETLSGSDILFTADSKGELFNSYGFELTRDDATATGVTCTVTESTPGVGTLAGAIDTSLAVLQGFGDAALVVCPAWDVTEMEDWKDSVNTASDADHENAQIIVYGRDVALSTAVSEVATLDATSDAWRVSIALCEGTGSSAATMAVQYAALISSEQNLARSLDQMNLDLGVPSASDRLTKVEQNVALRAGITPLAPASGGKVVKCVMAVMAGQKWGVLDLKKVIIGDYLRDYVLTNLRNKFRRMNIVSLDEIPQSDIVTNEVGIRQYIHSLLLDMNTAGYIQAPVYEKLQSQLVGGQVRVKTPFEAAQHLHQIYLSLENFV